MMLCGSRLLVDRIRGGKNRRLRFFGGGLRAAAPDSGSAMDGEGGGGSELSSSSSGSGSGSKQQQQVQKAGNNNKRNRPPVLSRLSALVARFRTFVRSKLMLKINGRPVLKLTGWHASVAFLLAGFLLTSLVGGLFGGAGGAGGGGPTEVPYSDFMKLVKDHGPDVVSRVRVAPDRFDFLMNGVPSFTRPVKAHPSLLFFLDKYNVPFYAGAFLGGGRGCPCVFVCSVVVGVRPPLRLYSQNNTQGTMYPRPPPPTITNKQAPPPPSPWRPSSSLTSSPSPGSSSPSAWGASSTGT